MKKGKGTVFLIWAGAIVFVIVSALLQHLLDGVGRYVPGLSFFTFVAKAFIVAAAIYWISAAIAFILRRLFWRVGRRLALSYFLIGVLPFICFAILLAFTGFCILGVLSQSAYRNERQSSLAYMGQLNYEYALAGKPATQLPRTIEVLDSERDTLPEWLRKQSFSGIVVRDQEALLVSSRVYELNRGRRAVAIVQPVRDWKAELEEKSSMVISTNLGRYHNTTPGDGQGQFTIGVGNEDDEAKEVKVEGANPASEAEDEELNEFLHRAWKWGNVIWGDFSPPLVAWESGKADSDLRLVSFISNPISNLVDYYFGSSEYANVLLGIIGGIAGTMLFVYLIATLFAAVLIFSISRAVNQIEKGTKAVENGDFSYRIRMKPRNQLGEVAQSFDRMTESIGDLLHRVAGQERLQSEIDIAATIQRNLLPREGPRFRGVSFSAHFEPTASIGGDYYDVFNLDRTRLAVTIGDVSGHGLSTGLVMAMVKAAMTTLVEEGAEEESLFRRLNELVFRSTEKRAFMTLAFTIFDLEKRTMRHTNAGHLYPYLIRGGEAVRALESSSLPLGVREDIDPHTVESSLEEHDTIVYLSDGIIEALDVAGEPFGFDSLERILQERTGDSPAVIQQAILDAVERHSGGRIADDDRTIMILRFDQIVVGQDEPAAAAGSNVADGLSPAFHLDARDRT